MDAASTFAAISWYWSCALCAYCLLFPCRCRQNKTNTERCLGRRVVRFGFCTWLASFSFDDLSPMFPSFCDALVYLFPMYVLFHRLNLCAAVRDGRHSIYPFAHFVVAGYRVKEDCSLLLLLLLQDSREGGDAKRMNVETLHTHRNGVVDSFPQVVARKTTSGFTI